MGLSNNVDNSEDMNWIPGGCHCGTVQFEVKTARNLTVQHCNCSICEMTGFIHLIVPGRYFRLISGLDSLSEYRFNTGVARHYFCKKCGVKSFYVPRSNPDGYSINLRCLNLPRDMQVSEQKFDGRHWEENAGQLHGLTGEDTKTR